MERILTPSKFEKK